MFAFRISELSSRMLKTGNADVTELSDPNRPMKLCEELNMVYDNEWTDCYEALTEDKDKKDDEAIDILYGMLQVHAECLFCCDILFELPHEKTSNVVSEQVQHKLVCTISEDA